MNSSGNYQGQLSEWQEEDPEGLAKFLESEREKSLSSYPEATEVRYCSICGEPLRYRSMSYDEGWHFDSCL